MSAKVGQTFGDLLHPLIRYPFLTISALFGFIRFFERMASRLLGTPVRYRRTDFTSYPDMERQMGSARKNRKEKKHNSRVSLDNLPIYTDLIKDIYVCIFHANGFLTTEIFFERNPLGVSYNDVDCPPPPPPAASPYPDMKRQMGKLFCPPAHTPDSSTV